MDSLNSMVKKLKPLCIYRLDENTNVYNELYAYSAGINLIFDELELLLREAFIQTSESFGLLTREKIFDSGHPQYSVDKRRDMLLGRMSVGEERHTLQWIKSFIQSLGVSCIITEKPHWRRIYAEITSYQLGADRQRYIEGEIRKIMPAHHAVEISFGNLSWDYVDGLSKSWEYFDGCNYTWQSINNMEV